MQVLLSVTRPILKILAVLCLSAALRPACAQPVARTPIPANPQPIGAGDIFDALTRPDAPSDLQRLRALRDSLAGVPDARTLTDMRAQLDTLLRDAEHREGELPPALVMSGIASRIDGAMTKLENARQVPPAPSFQGGPWLLPALGALAGTLAVCLAICLAALVAQGRANEESDELRETLTKIRRKLDDIASGTRKIKDVAGEMSDEAADSLVEAAVSIARINTSAKEAEGKLRASTDATDQRLQNAVKIIEKLETWLEELPSRLNEALGQPAESDAGETEGETPLSDRTFLLPGFLSSLQEACDEMRVTTEALAQANLAAAWPAAPELAENAALASEMTHLSFGNALKLDDVVAELARATEMLPELNKSLAEAAAQLPLQVERNAAATEHFQSASARAEATWLQLGQFIEQSLPEKLAELADTMTTAGIAALREAAEHCTEIMNADAENTDMPAGVQEALSAIAQAGAAQQAALSEAAGRLTQLAETLPETSASLAASAEALKRAAARDAKRETVTRAAIGEISAAAQSARADLAATADAVAAMPAQNDRLGALLDKGEQLLAGLETKASAEADELQRARSEALAGVEAAIGKIQVAAERLHAGADLQEQALARVRRAALTVATLAGADSANADETAPPAQTG